jgi:hypothetical protein
VIAAVVGVGVGVAAAGCELIVKTDDLSGGPADAAIADQSAEEGTPEAGRDAPLDTGGADARVQDAGAAEAEASTGPCATGGARVFVTSEMYDGNLGGIAGADAKCQASADAQSLGGTWNAWLATSSTTAPNHIYAAQGPYSLVDGTIVAASFNALLAGSLLHSLNVTETKASVADGQTEVWTATDLSGVLTSGFCAGPSGEWTSGQLEAGAPIVGHCDVTDSTWTSAYLQACNRTNVRLYCFERCK